MTKATTKTMTLKDHLKLINKSKTEEFKINTKLILSKLICNLICSLNIQTNNNNNNSLRFQRI